MILYPPAKINLGLRVTERRSDGFHDIETIFYPVGLSDILEFLPDEPHILPNDWLSLSGLAVPGEVSDNLLIRACSLYRERVDIPFFNIHLHKRIPVGAGLGGGSSDVASMLRGLNMSAGNPLNDEVLAELALELGSDCVFFLNPKPSIGRGRGEKLEPIGVKLSGYYLYMFNPGLHISTSDAYRELSPEQSDGSWSKVLQLPPEDWDDDVVNMFEESIFRRHPELATIKSDLYSYGAAYAAMSGSGSTIYGIFRHTVHFHAALRRHLIWQERISGRE